MSNLAQFLLLLALLPVSYGAYMLAPDKGKGWQLPGFVAGWGKEWDAERFEAEIEKHRQVIRELQVQAMEAAINKEDRANADNAAAKALREVSLK